MSETNQKYLNYGLGALFVVTIIILAILFFRSRSNDTAELSRSSFSSLATPTLVYQTPVPTPLPVRTFEDGSMWQLVSIAKKTYSLRGYTYDVGTFVNQRTTEQITAHCMQPGWASPPVGHVYRMNYGGVLIPTSEPNYYPYQRFLYLSDLP